MNNRRLIHSTLVVEDYDQAIAFFVGKLGFSLIEDRYIPEQDKRWVLVSPSSQTSGLDLDELEDSQAPKNRYAQESLLLARASNAEQSATIGNQTGGRVAFFLQTDDFWRDYESYRSKNIEFVRPPHEYDYGTVAVFKDLYGNLWDLIEYN